jgi:hypothetical protein
VPKSLKVPNCAFKCKTKINPFFQLKNDEVHHVTWWQLGSHVVAMGEYPKGQEVDVHNVEVIGPGSFNMGESITSEEFPPNARVHYDSHPAHQAYDPDIGVISTTGLSYYNETTKELFIRRVVYRY